MIGELGDLLRGRDTGAIPGVAVGVVQDGTATLACDGITSVDNPLPVTPSTRFQVGSVTKSMTATAAMVLVQRGRLALGDRVADLLLGVELGPAAATLTVEHLLTHTAGWQGDWALLHPVASRDSTALAELVAQASAVPRVTDPGGPFTYDNFGWCVLGRTIEVVTGQLYDAAITELVLRPLAMTDSVFSAEDAITGRVCAGHYPGEHGQAVVVSGAEPWADRWAMRRCLWPAGGLVTTLSDAMRWARFSLTGGTAPGTDPPIRDHTRQLMTRPWVDSGGQGVQAGLGWHLRYHSGVTIIGHSGLTQGFYAQVMLVPERTSALVALTNSSAGQGYVPTVVEWYLQDVLELPAETPKRTRPLEPLAAIQGSYQSITFSRLITVRDATEDTVTLDVISTDPNYSPTRGLTMASAGPGRLFGVDNPSLRAEYGMHARSRWLRYRGRLHLAPQQPR